MSSRSQYRLGEFVTLKRGYDLPHASRTPGDFPIVSSSGITGTHKEPMVKGPGVITGRYGTLGKVFYMPGAYWPLNTSLYVQDFKGNDPRFVAYFLRTVLSANFNSAGAVPGVNRNVLHKLAISPPPNEQETQRKIAAILTAYDELIQTNERRIALLERMAEELYREWFVRLRFPGHQDSKLVKGVPEGWTNSSIGSFAKFKYGYTESAVEDDALPKFLRVTDINKSSYVNWDRVPNCPIDDADLEKLRLEQHDIIIARMADPGQVAIMEGSVTAVFASYLIKIDYDRTETTPYYLFYTLSMSAYLEYFRGANSGATRGSINAGLIGKTNVLKPAYSIQIRFDELVTPIRNQLSSLLRSGQLLAQARDSLLRRLISGKLSVEDLDIQFPPSMKPEFTEPEPAHA